MFFWTGFTEKALYSAIRVICGFSVHSVELISVFHDGDRLSHLYRLGFSAPDRALEGELGQPFNRMYESRLFYSF